MQNPSCNPSRLFMVPFCSWCIFLRTTSCYLCSHQQWLSWRKSTVTTLTSRIRVSAGFSQHTVRGHGRRRHISQCLVVKLNHSLVAMCFLLTESRVWWSPWIHWWCWTALFGSPPRCSAPLWVAGSRSPRLGLNWRGCPTQPWPPRGSAACCC